MRLAVAAALFLVACSNTKPYTPMNYEKMGLETHNRGGISAPAVGSPDEERLGHEKIEAMQQEVLKARAAGTSAVKSLSASQPASAPVQP
jgi:hypothetical protein